jgi:hypothetical protein
VSDWRFLCVWSFQKAIQAEYTKLLRINRAVKKVSFCVKSLVYHVSLRTVISVSSGSWQLCHFSMHPRLALWKSRHRKWECLQVAMDCCLMIQTSSMERSSTLESCGFSTGSEILCLSWNLNAHVRSKNSQLDYVLSHTNPSAPYVLSCILMLRLHLLSVLPCNMFTLGISTIFLHALRSSLCIHCTCPLPHPPWFDQQRCIWWGLRTQSFLSGFIETLWRYIKTLLTYWSK